MKLFKLLTVSFLLAFSIGAVGCAEHSQQRADSSPSATPTAQEVAKDDGSVVTTTTTADGTKTEVRAFKTGEVARVTRTSKPGARRTATVEMRDGRKADLQDDSEVERVIDASADWIASAASKTWDTTKAVGREVGDKAEDVAGKTVDTSKDVGKKVVQGTKTGVKEAGDKAEDVGDKVGSTAKKVGKGAKAVGKKVKDKVSN
jgi:hypothetical protein